MQKRWKSMPGRGKHHRVMVEILNQIHDVLEAKSLPDWDPAREETLDRLVEQCWTLGLAVGLSPHLCMDRYCHCHIVLWEGEPEGFWPHKRSW